jgi:anti-sigma-K factor RskA
MKREDDEKLWQLLGHSAEPTVSPFFARNVLRKIRAAQGETSSRQGWVLRWLVPAAGVATVIIAALTFPTQLVDRPQRNSTAEVLAADSQDNDLLADLDDLVGPDDSLALDDGVLL